MANSSDSSATNIRGRWLLWIGYAACIWALLSGLNHAYQNISDAQFITAVHANALNILVMVFPSLLYWAGALIALAQISDRGRRKPGGLLLTFAWLFTALYTYFGIYPLVQAANGHGSLLLYGLFGVWCLLGALLFACLAVFSSRAVKAQRSARYSSHPSSHARASDLLASNPDQPTGRGEM